MSEEIRYHLPGVGAVSTPLHNESASLYRFLTAADEIDRLRALDHLGIVRHKWEGAHHPRWEYVVLTSCIIEQCKPIDAIHFSKSVRLGNNHISSGSELLKCWSLLMNIGHLIWTFTSERALLLELRQNKSARQSFLDQLSFDEEVSAWADQVIEKGRVHLMFQALSFIRLQELSQSSSQNLDPVWTSMLKAYVLSKNEKLVRLKAAYRNIRRVAYLALDTHYTPSLVNLDLAQILSDHESLQRMVLHDVWGETDELASLQDHLDRDIYLADGVIQEIAAREQSLRALTVTSLRHSGVPATISRLAKGDIQRKVAHEPLETIARIPFWVQAPLGALLSTPNIATEQTRLERQGQKLDPSVRVVAWGNPNNGNWILQTHSTQSSTRGRAAAYVVAFHRTAQHHRSVVGRLDGIPDAEGFEQRLLYGALASELILSALQVVVETDVRWEWTPRRGLRALLLPRQRAVSYLRKASSNPDLDSSARHELAALAEVVPAVGSDRYVAISGTNLVAYQEGEQKAELDGVAVVCSQKRLTVVLVEAKRQRKNAEGAARQALDSKLEFLARRTGVSTSETQSALDGSSARGWVRLSARTGQGRA